MNRKNYFLDVTHQQFIPYRVDRERESEREREREREEREHDYQ